MNMIAVTVVVALMTAGTQAAKRWSPSWVRPSLDDFIQ